MATWDITVSAQTAVAPGTRQAIQTVTPPGDFDGSTVNSVTVVGTPTITKTNGSDDSLGLGFAISGGLTSTNATYGNTGTGGVSAAVCGAVIASGTGNTSATITDQTPSPAPTTAVASEWEHILVQGPYTATMKNDADTIDYAAFTIRVDYTPSTPTDALLADDVETTSEVTTPTLGQEHALTATSVEATSEVTTPTLGQEHALLADDVEATSEVTTPTVAVTTPITADDVEATSELTVPTLGQEHALLADDVESTSEVGTPTLGQVHNVLADNVEAASEVTEPTLVSNDTEDNLSADDVETTSEVSIPTVGQIHVLAADDIESVSETSIPSITEVPAGGGGGGPVSYDPYWDDVYGLWRFEGADAATSTTDDSFQGLATTFTGDAQLDTAQFKFGTSSLLLDGTGDYIQATDAAAFNTPLNGDFTVEGWYRFNATANGGLFHFYPGVPPSTSSGLALGWDGTQWQIYANSGTHARAGSVSTGQWYHIALVRSSGSIQLYVDGVATGATVADATVYGGNNLHIGLYFSNSFTFNGWVDSFRVTDFARYTANFTPPTADFPTEGADPYWDDVEAVIEFNDGNGASNFTEEKSGSSTALTTGTLANTSPTPNEGASHLPGQNRALYILPSALGTGDFTMEWWFYSTGSSGNNFHMVVTGGAQSISCGRYSSQNQFVMQGQSTNYIIGGDNINDSTWNHLCVMRVNGVFRYYKNGVFVANSASTTLNLGDELNIGANTSVSQSAVDGVRVTTGLRYDTAGFTVPLAPYPTQPTTDPEWDNVVTLINADDGTITDLSNSAHTVTANGTAAASATQSKWGGQSVSIPSIADALTLPSSADFTFGTGDYTVEGWFYLSSLANNSFLDNRLDGAGDLVIYDSDGGAPVAPTLFINAANRAVGSSASTGQWYHIAATRESGTARFFIDGVQQGTDYADATNYTSTQFVVGNVFNYTSSLRGYLDDFRITKGVARYTSNFTVPDAPFPAQGAAGSGPTIDTQPQSQSVDENQTATFTVAATGTGTLTYQWTLGGVDISGATSSSYTTPTLVFPDDNGNVYAVKVTDDNGTTTSNNAVLTVVELKPTIDTQPQNTTVTEPADATFTVAATASTGGGALSYQWYEQTAGLLSGETSSTLVITNTEVADSGNMYYVEVTDANGTATSGMGTLTVNDVVLTITEQPATIAEAAEGSSVSFSAAATGVDPVAVQWRVDGGAVEGATGTTYVRTVLADDAGKAITAFFTAADGETAETNAATITTVLPPITDLEYTVKTSDYRKPISKRGYIELNRPLAEGETISIERNTGPVSNDMENEPFESFQTEQFEYTVDKYILRLQEIEAFACDCRDDYTVEPPPPSTGCLPEPCKTYSCSALDDYLTANATEYWPSTEATDVPPLILQPHRKTTGTTYDLFAFGAGSDYVEGSIGPYAAGRTGLDLCAGESDLRNRYNFLGRPESYKVKVYEQGTTSFVQDPTGPIDWSFHIVGGVDGYGLLWRKYYSDLPTSTGGHMGFQLDTTQGVNRLDWYPALSGDPADSLIVEMDLSGIDTSSDWLISTKMTYVGVSEQQVNVAFPTQGAWCMEYQAEVWVNDTKLYDGVLYAPYKSTTYNTGDPLVDPTVMSVTEYEMFRAMNITVGGVYRGIDPRSVWTAFERNSATYTAPAWCLTTPCNPPECEPYTCDSLQTYALANGVYYYPCDDAAPGAGLEPVHASAQTATTIEATTFSTGNRYTGSWLSDDCSVNAYWDNVGTLGSLKLNDMVGDVGNYLCTQGASVHFVASPIINVQGTYNLWAFEWQVDLVGNNQGGMFAQMYISAQAGTIQLQTNVAGGQGTPTVNPLNIIANYQEQAANVFSVVLRPPASTSGREFTYGVDIYVDGVLVISADTLTEDGDTVTGPATLDRLRDMAFLLGSANKYQHLLFGGDPVDYFRAFEQNKSTYVGPDWCDNIDGGICPEFACDAVYTYLREAPGVALWEMTTPIPTGTGKTLAGYGTTPDLVDPLNSIGDGEYTIIDGPLWPDDCGYTKYLQSGNSNAWQLRDSTMGTAPNVVYDVLSNETFSWHHIWKPRTTAGSQSSRLGALSIGVEGLDGGGSIIRTATGYIVVDFFVTSTPNRTGYFRVGQGDYGGGLTYFNGPEVSIDDGPFAVSVEVELWYPGSANTPDTTTVQGGSAPGNAESVGWNVYLVVNRERLGGVTAWWRNAGEWNTPVTVRHVNPANGLTVSTVIGFDNWGQDESQIASMALEPGNSNGFQLAFDRNQSDYVPQDGDCNATPTDVPTTRPDLECEPYAQDAFTTEAATLDLILSLNQVGAISGTLDVGGGSFTYPIEGTFGTPTQPGIEADGAATDYAQVGATDAYIDLTDNILKIDFGGAQNQNGHTAVVVNDLTSTWTQVGKFDWTESVTSNWVNVTDRLRVTGVYTLEGIWEARRVGNSVESRFTKTVTAATGTQVTGNPAPSSFVGTTEVETHTVFTNTNPVVLSVQGVRKPTVFGYESYGGDLHINGQRVAFYGGRRNGDGPTYNTTIEGERFFGAAGLRFGYFGILTTAQLVEFMLALSRADVNYTAPEWCTSDPDPVQT